MPTRVVGVVAEKVLGIMENTQVRIISNVIPIIPTSKFDL